MVPSVNSHRVIGDPGAQDANIADAGRAAVVADQELLWHVVEMIKAKHSTNRSEILTIQAIRIDAAQVSDRRIGHADPLLFPVLQGEVLDRDLGVEAIEGVETVVGLFMWFNGDGVVLVADGGRRDSLITRLLGVEDHDAARRMAGAPTTASIARRTKARGPGPHARGR
jgi:hypothetical protein